MKKKNNKGFSLIELIIAIAILVILTGLLAPQFMRYMEKSREAKDMQALDTMYSGVQVALSDEKVYDEVLKKAYTNLTGAGMTLDNILADTSAFGLEVKKTLGDRTEAALWSSKAAKDDKVNAYAKVDPDNLKVTVWLGTEADSNKPLSPTTTPATAGTTFYISK